MKLIFLLFMFFIAIQFSGLAKIDPKPQIKSGVINPDSLYKQADLLTDENKFEEAKEILDLLLSSKEKLPENLLWKCYSLMGYTQYFLGNYEASNQAYLKVFEKEQAAADTAKMAGLLKALGMNFRQLGLYSLSLQKYQEAISLFDPSKPPTNELANILNSISLLYYHLNDYPKVLEYSRKSLDISMALKDSTLMAFGYNNTAMAYHNLHQYDSSILFNKLALNLKIKTKNYNSTASTYNNLGLDYMSLNMLDSAKRYFDIAYSINKANNSLESLIINHNNYGSIFLKLNDLKKAQAHLDSAFRMLEVTKNQKLLIENLETQMRLFEITGDYKNGFEKLRLLGQVKETLFQDEVLKSKNLESAYAFVGIENEKLHLQQEAIIAKAASRRSSQLLILFAGIAVMFGMITLIYSKFSHSLKTKNEIIKLQKTDIIHRTGNVLARVQATLKSISVGFDDETSREKLMIAESVIVSAATLQEFTYSIEANKNKLELGSYLKEVVERLRKTFEEDEGVIHFIYSFQNECFLPVDKALNLGIIVSELVLNAMKYAFHPKPEKPEIVLALSQNNKNQIITIRDNGKGLTSRQSLGTGLDMVNKLIKYLNADLISLSDSNGTAYSIKLKAM